MIKKFTYLLWCINRWRILHWISWDPLKLDWNHIYFVCGKFVIVSQTKNLLWNVRHIAALTFSFKNQLFSNCLTGQNSIPKSKLFSFFIAFCLFTPRIGPWNWAGSNCVNPIYTKNLYWQWNTLRFHSTFYGCLMNAQYFREQNLSLAEFHFVVKLFCVKQLRLETMP